MINEVIIKRFWSKVDIKSEHECWNWLAGRFSSGCGSFWYLTRDVRASRFAYELTHGEISNKALVVCHSCDNPACCNPKHLWLGTTQENIADMDAKMRRAIRHGELCVSHKLKTYQVNEIRCLYASGKFNQYDLASLFNVNQSQISRIITRKRRDIS